MNVLNGESIIKGLLAIRVGISTVSSSFLTMYAISIYLFGIALLLLVAIILFMIHWRHQYVKSRKRLNADNLDSPDTPLTQQQYQNCQLKHYEKFHEKVPSVESIESNRYSQYDNYMSNDYDKNYNTRFLRKVDVI